MKLNYSVELIEVHNATDELITQWRKLASCSVDPNPYLSPLFVFPAVEYLSESAPLLFCVWEHNAERQRLVGLCVVNRSKGNLKLPFAHYTTFKSKHSFLDGVLIDGRCETEVIDCMAHYFSAGGNNCCGIAFSEIPADSRLFELLSDVADNNNGKWYEGYRFERACLHGKNHRSGSDQYYSLSGRKKKDLRRKMRRLKELGEVEWRLLTGKDVSDESMERFLVLEDMGWKGSSGTSLLSNSQETKFFRSIVKNFRDSGDIFFTELLLNGEIISSTCNFKTSDYGFAFKVAWNPKYKKYSPGILNEVEFLAELDKGKAEFRYIDSGASQDSYINALWLDRRTLLNGYLVFGARTILITDISHYFVKLRRSVRSLIKKVE